MKLISMTDFVFKMTSDKITQTDCINNIIDYARFLSQPLKLEMFVPCDEDGNVLEVSEHYEEFARLNFTNEEIPIERRTLNYFLCEEYQKAKERCLFEGFKHRILYDDDIVMNHDLQINLKTFSINLFTDGGVLSTFSGNKIEYLVELGVTLTPTAIKQIGL